MSLVAYCVKCKAKREIQNPKPVYTAKGSPATEGTCPVCGSRIFRMGYTPAHESIPKPDPPKPEGRLVIVESPAKARTVGRFLGKDYTVKASVGHVRDLLRSQLSVDVEHDFQPRYRVPNEKRQVVKELKKLVQNAAEVYLATDPDREGEAIAWHLMEATGIKPDQMRRVVFHEITRSAIEEAFSHPRDIDMQLVNAQQARRILDRLVGYKLSPLLWSKVRSRLSAGRVQSVALRLVVEREREIQAFVPVEYWSIAAELAKQQAAEGDGREEARPSFIAKLHRIRGEEVDLKNEADTMAIVEELETALYLVRKVKIGQRRRRPSPPFTTSTMQQQASQKLGFSASRTMRVAQQLYEGIELGDAGRVGLITYMRTDSTQVAEQAQQEARQYIAERFGERYLPEKPPRYKTKAKGAQEAHEAIRPTSVMREPKAIKPYLTRDQYRLYTLIWRRFVASQMAPAIFDTISAEIPAIPRGYLVNGEVPEEQIKHPVYLFRASGSRVRFPGFLVVYKRGEDEEEAPEDEGNYLPPLMEGEVLDLLRLLPEQHFTQPPPRYTEASLIKALESYGIGRPSTYAPIVSTIQKRGYVRKEGRQLIPTETGFIVNDLLVEHFPEIINLDFTAKMEADLDRIASGEVDWVSVVRDFYDPFAQAVARAEEQMPEVRMDNQPIGRDCPECGAPLVIKWGRYGKFIGCSRYPECRHTEPWLEKIGVTCPECGGDLVEKRTRRGRIGYGCSNYPTCNFWVWKKPLPQPCPNCGGLLTEDRKDSAKCTVCGSQFSLEALAEPVEALPVEEG